ncbi:BRCA1-A complex subunit RAP80 isoform X1 [Poecilia reticulata]|uniref:Ubiquitin interaction motif containing 1 n=1 Tax=Poecilia reticulata TaxID=8081 RepID=A0A3P9PWM2_POERE|nr:PREDICTED: BRCA1-A complex subunit RAP80 isoform X1 [Poecilia reticulata]
MRGRGRHSSSQSSATQQQSRMALRKKLAQNVSSDSQQDENTQEDKASTNTESRDELSSLLRSTSLTREKHRTERKNHCRRKEMTEEEEMDLALQLSKQEASNTELRQQQEDENVMKAIQESMVIQTQPGLTSPNKHLLDGVPQSTGSRRKLSYSNGERMPEEGGMNSGAVGPGDEIITRRKKQRKQAGSPLMKMPDLSQTQKVSSQISPSITESFSAHLDSPQSSDSTDIEDFQLQMSPVFPLTGCRAEVHVSRLNLDLVETCKSSGFVLCSQDSLISTQKSAQPRSPVFPQSNPIFCPKSPVFPGDDMGRERQLEQSPTFVKSPVFGRTADCSNHPACENTELSFSSQESSNPTVRSCSPHSPVFHKSHSGQSSLRKDPHRGQVERRDERSTSPTELQRTNLQLRASDCDQSPSGCRKDIKSDGCPTAECNRHSPKSEEVNENCEGWTSGEKELTSDMTLIWSEQEEDDVTPVGSPSPVFPEEKAAVPADNQLGSSPKHILVASQEPSGPDSSLKPQKCLSQLPTSTLQSHPLSRQEEVHRASPQRGEPSDRQTIHYYWGVPFCPRGLDPDTYTKVIVAQMEVYEKSLKEAQRGLLRKAEWGEAIQPEPQKSMSPETSSGSPQPCVSRRRGLRLRGSKRSEAADFLPEERKDDGEEEQQEKKEEGSKESDEVQMDTDDCEVCPETQLSDNNSTKDLNLNVDAETQPLQKNPELPEIEMILRGDSPIRHECQEPEPNLKTDSKMEENVSSCGEDVGGQTAQRVKKVKSRKDQEVEKMEDRSLQRSECPVLEAAVVPHSPEASVDCPLCQGSFPASEIEMHAAYCDGEVAVVDQRRPESQGFQDPLKPRRKRMKTTEVVSEETTQLSDVCRNQEKCYICQKSVLLRDYSRHTELCLQRGTVSRKGNLLSALEKTESRDSGAGPSGSKPQPEAVIDLRDDEDEEVSAYRINNSPIRSFTPISEATGCLIDFRKQQRPKKPSQRRR